MSVPTDYEQTDEVRDLRNVLLFGMASVLMLSALAVVGSLNRILNIPLSQLFYVLLVAFFVAVAGLIGVRLKRMVHELAWGALLAWTILATLGVHLTGGPQTPMPALYVLITVAASFLLGRSGAMAIALLSVASYGLMLALEYTGVVEIVLIWNMPFEPRGRELLFVVNLLTVAAPTLGTALLAGSLAERLAERNQQSEELRQQLSERLANVRQANSQLRALQTGLSTFQSVLELDETFSRIATAVCGLGYMAAYIAAFDERSDSLNVRTSITTLPVEAMRAAEALAGGKSLLGATFTRSDVGNIGVQSFLSGRTMVSQNLHDFYRPMTTAEVANEIAQMFKFGCGASVPLRVEGRPVGNLFAFATRSSLSEADLDLLQAFADQASVALERARLFAEVHRGRDRLQVVLNSIRDGVLMFDREGQSAVRNPAATELLGLEAEALLGASLFDILDHLGTQAELDSDRLLALKAMFADAEAVSERHTFEFPGPPHRYLELMCWPVSGQAGEVIGRLAVLHDVTHQKELEAAREDWTRMLVHDLRGPLNNIIAGLYLAKDTIQSENRTVAVRSAELALEGAEHLLDLINSLLDVYKLESGQMQLEIAPVDLLVLVNDSLRPFESIAHSDRVQLVTEVGLDVPMIHADAGALQRVLSNLVDNALKFTPQGGRITVRAELIGEAVRIDVVDTGPGIPVEARAHIFDKFAQVPGSKGKRRGTGLGLTFCKLAVEAHGGRVWVDCPPEGGSVFTFTLPLGA